MDKASSRLRVLALLVAFMFVTLSARLWFLQVLATDRFEKDARSNSVRIVATDPLRGKIYDDHNRVLVANHASIVVRVNRSELGAQPEAVERELAKLLGINVDELRANLRTKLFYSYQPIPVAVYTDTKPLHGQKMTMGQAVEAEISEHPDQYPGVDVVHTSVRSYPHTRLAAQILGYMGPIDSQEYAQLKDKGYGLSDQIGRAGLEQVYEPYLRGVPGKQKYIVNSDGDTIRVLGGIPATPGNDLHLTLDVPTQRAVEQELQRGMIQARKLTDSTNHPLRANAGAVVVMNAHTGGIVAMASLPSYDPTWWVNGPTKTQRKYLGSSTYTPLLDRAVQLPYIPGSTFKPITGLAAVKEGFASLSGSYDCAGEYTYPGDLSGTVFHNWTPVGLGPMSLNEALWRSCDTVFYALGAPFWSHYADNQGSPDAELLQRDLREWGFGAPTGIDLPGEASGLVPDAAWAQANPKIFPYGPIPGLDIRTMIGSTYVTATPLQMAEAYAAIANGGHLCRPHLVKRVVAPDGTVVKGPDTKCDRTLPYTSTQLSYIRNALALVPTIGTAACPFAGFPFSQVAVAGKTGTAERGDPTKQDTSWFMAMVGKPGQEPDYVIATMVEQGGFGSQVAAPITRAIIERLYGLGQTPHTGCSLQDH